jgi:hypothetical protein
LFALVVKETDLATKVADRKAKRAAIDLIEPVKGNLNTLNNAKNLVAVKKKALADAE